MMHTHCYCTPTGDPSTDEPRVGDKIKRVRYGNDRCPTGTEETVASGPPIRDAFLLSNGCSIYPPYWTLISRTES